MKMKSVLGAAVLVHDSLPVSPYSMNNSLVGGQQPAGQRENLQSYGYVVTALKLLKFSHTPNNNVSHNNSTNILF